MWIQPLQRPKVISTLWKGCVEYFTCKEVGLESSTEVERSLSLMVMFDSKRNFVG